MTDYRVVLRMDGFFNAYAGRPWQLTVAGGVIRAAVDGMLVAIAYDAVWHYPVLVRFAGAPDAGGTITLTNLQPTPIPVSPR